jgi:hypothetical protein
VRFEDGSEVREWWDARDEWTEFIYASRSRATVASVDPGAVLLLDRDRTNNTRRLVATRSPLGVRLALNWFVWLQDLMLSYTAVA